MHRSWTLGAPCSPDFYTLLLKSTGDPGRCHLTSDHVTPSWHTPAPAVRNGRAPLGALDSYPLYSYCDHTPTFTLLRIGSLGECEPHVGPSDLPVPSATMTARPSLGSCVPALERAFLCLCRTPRSSKDPDAGWPLESDPQQESENPRAFAHTLQPCTPPAAASPAPCARGDKRACEDRGAAGCSAGTARKSCALRRGKEM